MKLLKFLMVIAVITAIGFSMIGCDDPDPSPSPTPTPTPTPTPPTPPTPGAEPTQILNVSVTVTRPMFNEAPVTTATTGPGYTAGAVAWSANSQPVTGNFAGNTAYTATVTVTAHDGYTFANTLTGATINGNTATSTVAGGTATLSYTFIKTLSKGVSSISISNQPTNLSYTYPETLDLTGLQLSIVYSDSSLDNGTFAQLSEPSRLGDNIQTVPAEGTVLNYVYWDGVDSHRGRPVVISVGGKTASTNNINVSQGTTTVTTWPTASALPVYGSPLSASTLTGGVVDGTEGIFYWTNPGEVPTVTNSGYSVTFTPNNPNYANATNANVAITVDKADMPDVPWPSIALRGIAGEPLNSIDLTEYNPVYGTFSWQNGNEMLTLSSSGSFQNKTIVFTANQNATNNFNNVVATQNRNHPVSVTLGYEMVGVVYGSFMMGRNGTGASGNLNPIYKVNITKTFSIGKYEVTQDQYEYVMGGNPNLIEAKPSINYDNPVSGDIQGKRPVENMSWYETIVFCNRLSILEGLTPVYSIDGRTNPDTWGVCPTATSAVWNGVIQNLNANGYRLPTESEWEYAAKGGPLSRNYIYSGSNTINDVSWYNGNSSNKTHEVGKKLPNELGIYDMSGNVSEWVWDWNFEYTSDEKTDPTGPSFGVNHAVRSGSFYHDANTSRCVNRSYGAPIMRYNRVGIRLVRSGLAN